MSKIRPLTSILRAFVLVFDGYIGSEKSASESMLGPLKSISFFLWGFVDSRLSGSYLKPVHGPAGRTLGAALAASEEYRLKMV